PRYPRHVDREYLSCRSGGLNKIQMIDGGTPDLDQDLVGCNRRPRYIVEHQLPTIFQQSDNFHASSPQVCPMGATRAGASEFRTCQSPVASNVMSKPKVLDAQSQGIVQLPDISTIGDIPGRTMLAHLRAEVAGRT